MSLEVVAEQAPPRAREKMLDGHDTIFHMQDALFISGMDAAALLNPALEQFRRGAVRMRLADRSQVGIHFCSIDELAPVDHPVRMLWDAVCQMDLSAFVLHRL